MGTGLTRGRLSAGNGCAAGYTRTAIEELLGSSLEDTISQGAHDIGTEIEKSRTSLSNPADCEPR